MGSMRPIILVHEYDTRAAPLHNEIVDRLRAEGRQRVMCDFTPAWRDRHGEDSDVAFLKPLLWGQQVDWPDALLVDVAAYIEDRDGKPLEKAAETIVRLAHMLGGAEVERPTL